MIRLIVSTGDTNGIGLEVFLKSLFRFRDIAAFDDVSVELVTNTKTFNDYLQFSSYSIKSIRSTGLSLIQCNTYSPIVLGEANRRAAQLAIESLDTAISIVTSTTNSALLTLPISKAPLQEIGWKFPGQTEFVEFHSNNRNKAMMILHHQNISFGLATIHIPVNSVASNITQELLTEKIFTQLAFMDYDLGVRNPKLAVLGLNPHAGEEGKIGSEDDKILKPVISRMKKERYNVEGPFPADAFFGFGEFKRFDGILAMYHDQGLIPAKMLSNGHAVNVTAGTNIVRTSPDHGVAYPIAGKWIASEESTFQAMILATNIIRNRLRLNNQS
ncbi:MAG: 4-hydroxythreonine-4-phosphate dehydrogenase PdxA [Candidatus Kapabacteria bacterium]|nr:4-hydroxythreonine-4-phosphate dehydrogenase PdxA [Candidatus Kapabacteria bacterium]